MTSRTVNLHNVRCLLLLELAAILGQNFYSQSVMATNTEKPSRPNIILIMADDLGVECLGSYGGLSYATPHLDQMAAEGMRFTHAYSQPLCTNTRIQLMTGMYNNRNWKYFGILDPKAKTIGHYMQEAGYETCIAGKWQLQSYDPPDYPGAAMRRDTGMRVENAGFDQYSLWHIRHTEDKGSRYSDPTINENGTFLTETNGKYGPDLWVKFINNYVSKEKERDKPFFLYYPMALPHWPMVPTPSSIDWNDPSKRFNEDTKYFKDMVEYMDMCVGRIVENVDKLGLAEETLIIFYSDNGTHRKITSQMKDGPVVGGKGLTTNAGTHVPLIVRWKGTIERGLSDVLIDSTDFLPTVLEAAGKSVPVEDNNDGISFYPTLLGKETKPRSYVFCHYDPRPGWDKDQFGHIRFARNKRYKLYGDGRFYDIETDPLEKRSIAHIQETTALAVVRQQLDRILKEQPDPEPAPRDPLHFKPMQQTKIVPKESNLELVWGNSTFTEGPTVAPDGAILFSDVRESKTWRFDPKTKKTTLFRENTGSANGLAHDVRGRLYSCEGADGGGRRISVRYPTGSTYTVVDNWNGKKFNSPNDLAIVADSTIYFTDPRYRGPEPREIDFEGVFFVRQEKAYVATKEVERPNGIVISHDATKAYIADNNNDYGGARKLYVFDIEPDKTFTNRKELFDFGMGRRGIDGMTIDAKGNLYATAGNGADAGVYVFGPNGEHLAVIQVPDLPTNCTFGGRDEPNTLYITAQVEAKENEPIRFGLYRIKLANLGP